MNVMDDIRRQYNEHQEEAAGRQRQQQVDDYLKATHPGEELTDEDKAELAQKFQFVPEPLDLEIIWSDGKQSVVRVEAVPEDSHGFIGRLRGLSNTTAGIERFQNFVYTFNPDQIRAFRRY